MTLYVSCAVSVDRAAADEEPQAALHHSQGRQRGHQAGEALPTLALHYLLMWPHSTHPSCHWVGADSSYHRASCMPTRGSTCEM